jgi:hypothetical protein
MNSISPCLQFLGRLPPRSCQHLIGDPQSVSDPGVSFGQTVLKIGVEVLEIKAGTLKCNLKLPRSLWSESLERPGGVEGDGFDDVPVGGESSCKDISQCGSCCGAKHEQIDPGN